MESRILSYLLLKTNSFRLPWSSCLDRKLMGNSFQSDVVTGQAPPRNHLKRKGSVVTQITHVSFVFVYVKLLTVRTGRGVRE